MKNLLKTTVDKKNINDCTVTVKDGVTTVLNGYLPVPATEYTSENRMLHQQQSNSRYRL